MNELLSVALGNALLGLAAVFLAARVPRRLQEIGRRTLGGTGVILGLSLAVTGRDGLTWRSVSLGPDEALLTGLAIGAMWALLGSRHPRPSDGLFALAAAALVFAVGADWLVPQLLFYLSFFWGLAAAGFRESSSPWEVWRPLVALTLIAGGSLLSWFDSDSWRIPEDAEVLARSVALLGAALTLFHLPLGRDSEVTAAPGAPLLVAAGFSLISSVADGAPYPGVVFLGSAVLIAAGSWFRRRPDVAAATVPLLSLGGAALLVPEVAIAAGVAAVLVAAANGAGRLAGDPFRAALNALAPITAGAAALGFAAETTLARVGTGGPDATGWAVAAALLPGALASSLWAGAATGRSEDLDPPAHIGLTAALLGASLLISLSSGALLGLEPLGSGGGAVVLILVAVAAGGAVTVVLALRDPHAEAATFPIVEESHRPEERAAQWTHPPHPALSKSGGLVVVILGAAGLAMVGWLTFQGLRVGFL